MSHGSHGDHSNHRNHGNHNSSIVTYSVTSDDTGAPMTLSWEDWDSQNIDDVYVSSSIDKIKELREKIDYLKNNKSGISGEVSDNPSTDFTGAEDQDFNDADPGTPEYIDDVQYDTIKNNLEALYTHMKNGQSTNLNDANEGEFLSKEKIELIRIKIDELATYDSSPSYVNHNNHSSHVNYRNTVHSSHNSSGRWTIAS